MYPVSHTELPNCNSESSLTMRRRENHIESIKSNKFRGLGGFGRAEKIERQQSSLHQANKTDSSWTPPPKMTVISTRKLQKTYHQSRHCEYLLMSILILLQSIQIFTNIRPTSCNSIAPSIDYSHNMRILKLPRSTPIGSLIYRLKGSDGDPNTQLQFGVSGIEARALIDVLPVAHSWNEADVYLKASLTDDGAPTHYNLTLYVSDGNTTTQVDSTVLVTDPEGENASQQEGGLSSGPVTPFLNTKHIIHVPENTRPDETIGQVTVMESETNDLPVRFELRGRGSERFSIKYVFGPRGHSRAELVLAQPVDYERQNLFTLKVLALNAWTDTKWDTRNVVTMDLVITLDDVQDTAPVFRSPPHSIRLFNTLQPGDSVVKIEAEDGDLGHQRPVHFALDASSPLANYFEIDKLDGQLRLTRPISELILHASWDSPSWSQLTILASEPPDPSSYDHLWPPMYSKLDIPLMLVDLVNEAPQFVGGWQTVDATLHAYLVETPSNRDPSGLCVQWYTNGTQSGSNPTVIDLGLGMNGTFQLTLEGPDASLFRIEPSLPISRQSSLFIFVADSLAQSNWSIFDRDSVGARQAFNLDIIANDFGSPHRMSSRIHCKIELVDSNDNPPQFESDLYSFNVYENAPRGHIIGAVRARDPDHQLNSGRVRYGTLSGRGNHLFRLDQDTGQVSLDGQLDRERESTYLLLAEAFDPNGVGLSNYTKVMITVLDINDNAPMFLQSSYDVILQADGTFHQPVVVRAIDTDEPGTANSQVAYEIIAGNRDELFVIDSFSGSIHPASQHSANFEVPKTNTNPAPMFLPPEITNPIKPYNPSPSQHSSGKILPGREVEETTWPPNRTSSVWNTGAASSSGLNNQQQIDLKSSRKRTASANAMGADPILSSESEANQQTTRSLINRYSGTSNKLPPMITLIVRAHDFGIPVRSSTARVNIYNQALLTRTLSLILNGTSEQVEARSDAIERAFSSITGSKAQIEAVETLSDSSSLCVAHVRLSMPQHNLVDLTDLTALIDAIDYHPHSYPHSYSHSYPPQHESNQNVPVPNRSNPSSYIHPPDGHSMSAANITGSSFSQFLGDFHNPLSDSSLIERRLLIYIIIVAICILSLLVIWMIYWCCQEDRKSKIIESTSESPNRVGEKGKTIGPPPTAVKTTLTQPNHLVAGIRPNSLAISPTNSTTRLTLLTTGTGQQLKPDRYSMYNGQVWFEPAPVIEQPPSSSSNVVERRISSAPSANGSLHSAIRSVVRARNGRGQFFPNALGYTQNLASIQQQGNQPSSLDEPQSSTKGRNQARRANGNRRRITPMDSDRTSDIHKGNLSGHTNRAFVNEPQDKLAVATSRAQKTRSGSISSAGTRSSGAETLILDSDQELLGFDSTGTPIIATLAGRQDLPRASSFATDRFPPSSRLNHKPPESRTEREAQRDTRVEVKVPVSEKKTDSSANDNIKVDQKPDVEQPRKSELPILSAKTDSPSTEPGVVMEELNRKLAQRNRKLSEPEEKPEVLISARSTSVDGQGKRRGSKDTEISLNPSELDTGKSNPTGDIQRGRRGKLERTTTADKSVTSSDTESNTTVFNRMENDIKNGELLKKQSIFALTYDGVAAEKLPVD